MGVLPYLGNAYSANSEQKGVILWIQISFLVKTDVGNGKTAFDIL